MHCLASLEPLPAQLLENAAWCSIPCYVVLCLSCWGQCWQGRSAWVTVHCACLEPGAIGPPSVWCFTWSLLPFSPQYNSGPVRPCAALHLAFTKAVIWGFPELTNDVNSALILLPFFSRRWEVYWIAEIRHLVAKKALILLMTGCDGWELTGTIREARNQAVQVTQQGRQWSLFMLHLEMKIEFSSYISCACCGWPQAHASRILTPAFLPYCLLPFCGLSPSERERKKEKACKVFRA